MVPGSEPHYSRLYDVTGKNVSDTFIQELLPRYATEEEAETLISEMYLRGGGLADQT